LPSTINSINPVWFPGRPRPLYWMSDFLAWKVL
jgi:hypothetical protein